MGFGQKVKAAFSRRPSDAPAGTTSAVTSAINKKEKKSRVHRFNRTDPKWENWPEHVYKPHEIPDPKYKRPPTKEHKQHLENYTWDADVHADDRRGSAASQYSPMGSRLPSRRASSVVPAVAIAEEDAEEDPLGRTTIQTAGADGAALTTVETARPLPDLSKVDTIKPAPDRAKVAAATPAPQHQEHAAGPLPVDALAEAFDGVDLTRALTAIHDHRSAEPGLSSAATPVTA